MMINHVVSDYAVRPGLILQETLDAYGMSQAALAERMGRPAQVINEIIAGKKAITEETAIQLERVLGTPAHVWSNLEREYQMTIALLQDEEKLRSQILDLENFPYLEMARWGFVQHVKDKLERVKVLLHFFGVTDLSRIPKLYSVAFQRGQTREASPYATAAWLRQGEVMASRIETAPYSADDFDASLPELRAWTNSTPSQFREKLLEKLACCGVVLVLVPHLPKTYACGATYWLNGRPVIQLSLRFKTNDQFWFSFFHEAGHILLHGKREVFLETKDRTGLQEEAADRFAADCLIPPDRYTGFLSAGDFSSRAITGFADRIGIAPGIVVGRLQHDRHIPFNRLNCLKLTYEWGTKPINRVSYSHD